MTTLPRSDVCKPWCLLLSTFSNNGKYVAGHTTYFSHIRNTKFSVIAHSLGKSHALIYDIGNFNSPIEDFGGGAVVSSVNDNLEAVGYKDVGSDFPPIPAFWKNGMMKDINDLITPGSGWLLTEATAINNLGQIVGSGFSPNGKGHAFLLTPTGVDLVATSLAWDIAPGGVNFTYDAKGGGVSNATAAKVFWANGTNVANILSSTTIFTNDIPVGFTGASPTNHVPAANLLNAPSGTTHLLLVVDPDHLVTESNTNNNTRALPLADGLLLSSTLSGKRREIFTSANGTVIKYEEPGDEGDGYDIFSIPASAPTGVYFSPLTQPPFGPSYFPSVNMDSTKVTDAVDPNVNRYRAMGDKRPSFLVNDLPQLYQSDGNWAASVLNPDRPPKADKETVAQIGCALTILSMAAKYTARDPAKIQTLIDDDAINSVSGAIANWTKVFSDLQKFSKDSEYKLVPAATFLGINVQISVAPGEPPDATDFFNDLESTMRANNAAAILQVPSLSDPNNVNHVHFVLCIGVENDQGNSLPLKRFRIYDPGRRNFKRSDTIPIRYLDQHFDNLLRQVDFTTDAVIAVRFFVVPNKIQPGSLSAPKQGPALSGLKSQREEADNSSPASTYLSYSVPGDANLRACLKNHAY